MTSLRQQIRDRAPLRGPFLALPSVAASEIMLGAAPDFVCIDTEHSPISDEMMTNMIRAADLAAIPALVRVRSAHGPHIAAALDAGACGILVPHVSTAETARAVVGAARFAPEGHRGAGPGRAAGYVRAIPAYLARARTDTVVAVQLETLEAVRNAADILAVPGIDLAFIGPGDLGIDLVAQGSEMSLEQAIDAMIAAADAAQTPAGIFTPDRSQSAHWLTRLSFVIEGSDAQLLTRASDAAFARLGT
tara:strand:+ start:751 stop:1494 length:744 start_codon:yes stop_codon:yes gene_type:complete